MYPVGSLPYHRVPRPIKGGSMPSEMVGIWGSFVYMPIIIHLGNKTNLVVFSALKLIYFMFLYFIQDQWAI